MKFVLFIIIFSALFFLILANQLSSESSENGCGKLRVPHNGNIVKSKIELQHKNIVTYNCDENFVLVGPSQKVCIKGVWIPKEIPYCVQKCSTLEPPQYGSIEQDGKIAIINCEDGYENVGPTEKLCKNGDWLPKKDIDCVKKCSPLKNPLNGKVIYSDDTLANRTIATFKCDDGYENKNTVFRSTCINGVWTPVNSTTCEKTCALIETPYGSYLDIFYSNPYLCFEGATVQYNCQSFVNMYNESKTGALDPRSPSQSTCIDGNWLPPPEIVRCIWTNQETGATSTSIAGYDPLPALEEYIKNLVD